MTISERHLTNNAYGKRTDIVTPCALACIHITGNARTAAYTDLHAAADAERDYANRAGSTGPSAHYYVARDGWAIEAINPELYWAWSNGDVKSPNLDNPGIARVLRETQAKDLNPNRAYWLEFENVGYGSDYPVTAAQRQFCAERIAAMAKAKGMKVNRETVHGHWEINGIDRQTCPSPNHEGFLNDVIDRANAILNPPAPAPEPQETEMLTITDRTPKLVTLAEGVQLYDPGTGAPIVKTSGTTTKPSYYATPIGRALSIYTRGAWTLLAAKAGAGVTIADMPADTTPYSKADLDAAVQQLQDQIADDESADAAAAAALQTIATQLTN